MPKIAIREVDNTGTSGLPSVANVVYIPGTASVAVEPTLFTTPKEFKDTLTASSSSYDADCLSAKLAYTLLKMGMQILYEGIVVESSETGGTPDVNINWDRLKDKSLYDIRFLTTGEFWKPSSKMVECAATRCDAVALIDVISETPDGIRSELASILNTGLSLKSTKDPDSFAAVFTPTISMYLYNLDETDSREVVSRVPASFGYLCAYAKSVQTNPSWYAIAGSVRGVIPGLTGVSKKYTTAEVEMLQARSKTVEVELDDTGDNVGVAINPIVYQRPFGIILWGNRTARDNKAGDDGTGILKATSFLNCRVLSTEVAKIAYIAARKFTFEQNNEVLWANFTSFIAPTLDKMVSGNGILDYKITRVPTTKKARLAAKIVMIPIEAVEDFDITIELEDDVSVTE